MSARPKLSPWTRWLAAIVLVGSVVFSYVGQRAKPVRGELARQEREVRDLRQQVRQARDRVEQLSRDSAAAERWSGYALALQQQSTGRSLRDLLQTCGTEQRPEVAVKDLRFARQEGEGPFRRIGVRFGLEGRYGELMRLFHELDAAFPPLETRRVALRLEEGEEGETLLNAQVEGTIHEPW